jgi:acylphosphatase
MVRRRVVVSGRVQGVHFRAACEHQARTAGVSGWVRNRDDGSVEAVLEGDEDAVERVLAWCHQGPPRAQVTDVAVEEEEPVGETGFSVRA